MPERAIAKIKGNYRRLLWVEVAIGGAVAVAVVAALKGMLCDTSGGDERRREVGGVSLGVRR